MTLLERLRPHGRFPPNRPPDTTPVFDQSNRNALVRGVTKLLAIPLVALALLLWFGHPALRISYQWNGNKHAPVYYRCTYLAIDGRHTHRPLYGTRHCPAIISLPFNLTTLRGVFS